MLNVTQCNQQKVLKRQIPKNQSGSAIIVALFVVALVAAIATTLLIRLQQDTRRTELILNANQAYFYAQGSIAWAMDQLINNEKQHQQQPNQLTDKTPITLPKTTIHNATIETIINDAQGLFNLNNLTDKSYHNDFMRLIKAVTPKLNANEAQSITTATIDWISPNTKPSNDKNYRPTHQRMISPSELRLVKGMTADLYSKLSPHITALPTTTPININNTSAPILISLSPSMTQSSANALIALSQQTPFASVKDFQNLDIVKNNKLPENKITTHSDYFLVKTKVTLGDQKTILYTLLQRQIKNSQPSITILWQSKGTL